VYVNFGDHGPLTLSLALSLTVAGFQNRRQWQPLGIACGHHCEGLKTEYNWRMMGWWEKYVPVMIMMVCGWLVPGEEEADACRSLGERDSRKSRISLRQNWERGICERTL